MKIGQYVKLKKDSLICDTTQNFVDCYYGNSIVKKEHIVEIKHCYSIKELFNNNLQRSILNKNELNDFENNVSFVLHDTYVKYKNNWIDKIQKKYGKDILIIEYGSSSSYKKYILETDVSIVDDKHIPKQPIRKTPTKRELMVKGSKWKIINDFTTSVIDWKTLHPQSITYQFKMNDIITISGKFQVSFEENEGLLVPFTCNKIDYCVPSKDVMPNIEPIEIPETFYYVLSDTNNKYFSKIEYTTNQQDENELPDATALFVEKISQAKKYKNLSSIKSSILYMSDYYSDFNYNHEIPDWLFDSRDCKLPKKWNVIKYNKFTKLPVETIYLEKWFTTVFKMKQLTMKYGSAVTNIFNQIDEENSYEKFKIIILYESQEEDSISKNDIKELNNILKQISLNKKSYIKKNTTSTYAIAIEDKETALMIKMAYNGNLCLKIIDIDTLKEIVETS